MRLSQAFSLRTDALESPSRSERSSGKRPEMRVVQELLGHASIRTTEVYTHLDSEHVTSLHRLYHPRG